MIESQSVISYATESEGLKCVVGWVLLRDLFYMVKNGVFILTAHTAFYCFVVQ